VRAPPVRTSIACQNGSPNVNVHPSLDLVKEYLAWSIELPPHLRDAVTLDAAYLVNRVRSPDRVQ
jgi:hypothetical protein